MGAYYRYDMDRLMVLMNHRGKDVFISVTRQKKPSTVGRKGAIIGKDTDWNYFYSGEKGLSKTGFGWVSSYMYDAFSVAVFFEPVANQPRTRVVNFKWLNAAGAGSTWSKGRTSWRVASASPPASGRSSNPRNCPRRNR